MAPGWKDYAFLAKTLVGITLMGFIIYAFTMVPEDWDARWNVVTWLTTGVICSVTIALLFWRNHINDLEFKEQVKSGYSERFKTGVELLAAEEPPVKNGGIIVLRELALERSEQYTQIVGDLLLDYVNTQGHLRPISTAANDTRSAEPNCSTSVSLAPSVLQSIQQPRNTQCIEGNQGWPARRKAGSARSSPQDQPGGHHGFAAQLPALRLL